MNQPRLSKQTETPPSTPGESSTERRFPVRVHETFVRIERPAPAAAA